MPLVVLDSGIASATGVFGARSLIPGVEPGGSRVGKSKPALLIRDLAVELTSIGRGAATADFDEILVSLALSQEPSLDPALHLRLANYIFAGPATADQETMGIQNIMSHMHLGTTWAPAFVGGHITEVAGQLSSYQVRIYLNYQMVEVDWMDWFIMWDFLDNVVDGDVQY